MLKPCDEYKNTDQLWLNSVPEHWDMIKTKHLFDERSSKGFPNEPLLVASQSMGVVPKGVYGSRTVEATKDLHLLKLVKCGDFVISLRSFQGGIEYAYYQGIISPAYTIMIPKSLITSNYFRHLAKSKTFIELLQMCVTGIREGQNVDYNKLKNFRLPVPPREEQDQIVKHLDWQTSKINTLIKAKKKQIELLKEQKQAVINKAVTKGLDDTVPMKDSGVEWLGQVPEHWLIVKLKMVSEKIGDGLHGTPEYDENGEYYFINGNNLGARKINLLKKTNKVNENEYIKHFNELNKNTILISLNGTIGNLSIYDGEEIILSKSAGYICLKDFQHKEFLYLYLQNKRLLEFYNLVSSATTIKNLSLDTLRNTVVLLPPREEQQSIVCYLEEKTALIEKAITVIEKEIELVSEYKTSLISSVVTGKVDVSDVIVPDFEVVDEVAENIQDDEDEMEG